MTKVEHEDEAPTADAGDLALIRGALRLSPAERLARVVASYPLVRTGLLRRRAAGGDPRP